MLFLIKAIGCGGGNNSSTSRATEKKLQPEENYEADVSSAADFGDSL